MDGAGGWWAAVGVGRWLGTAHHRRPAARPVLAPLLKAVKAFAVAADLAQAEVRLCVANKADTVGATRPAWLDVAAAWCAEVSKRGWREAWGRGERRGSVAPT